MRIFETVADAPPLIERPAPVAPFGPFSRLGMAEGLKGAVGAFARKVRLIEAHHPDRRVGLPAWIDNEWALPRSCYHNEGGGTLHDVTIRLPDFSERHFVVRSLDSHHARNIALSALFNRVDPESRKPLDQVLGCTCRDLDDARIVAIRRR